MKLHSQNNNKIKQTHTKKIDFVHNIQKPTNQTQTVPKTTFPIIPSKGYKGHQEMPHSFNNRPWFHAAVMDPGRTTGKIHNSNN